MTVESQTYEPAGMLTRFPLQLSWWVLVLFLGALVVLPASALDNAYTNTVSGKWEGATNWSQAAPFLDNSIYITNSGTKTVTVDPTTVSVAPGTLAVTNVTISGPSNTINTLLVANTGTNGLRVHEDFTLLSGGALNITNSTFTVDCQRPPVGATDNDSHIQLDAPAVVNASVFNASNAFQTMLGGTLGGSGVGTLSVTNSTFKTYKLFVGYYSDASAAFVNSTSRLGDRLTIADVYGHTGGVSILGGQFVATNTAFGPDTKSALIGGRGSGQLTVSNANVQLNLAVLGVISGSDGTLNMQGGTMTMSKMFLGFDSPTNNLSSSGTLFMSGGQIFMPELHDGYLGTGSVVIAGGLISNSIVALSENPASFGSLTITGGTHLVSSLLTVGSGTGTNFVPGTVSVGGGGLFVTNAAGTAVTLLNGSSLLHGGGAFKTDNLILTNGGSVITVSNYTIGATAGTTNTLALTDGSSLVISNATLGLGNDGTTSNGAGRATAVLSNATLSATTINLGSTAGGVGSITIQANASVNVFSNLTVVSGSLTSTSSITVAGGSLTATNGAVTIGSAGSGSMTISSGTVTAKQITLGGVAASGDLTVQTNGHLKILSTLSANLIVLDGDLDGSGGTVIIGQDHNAAMRLNSGGTARLSSMYVGYSPGFTGTYNQFGGVMTVQNTMVIGACDSGAVGVTTLSGGTMYVTNAAHNAVLDVRYGTLALNPGAGLVVDVLVVTNSCGRFINNGGTLTAGSTVLEPNLDADGDGQSNAREAAAGTDPLDPNSSFRLVSIARTGVKDIRVDWTSVGGHSYVVQVLTNSPGWFTGSFVDLSGIISVGGSGPGTANYTHVNGATNRAGYYRVRLSP